MKKNLFILSLLFISACSYFRENYRTVTYDARNGDRMTLTVFEQKEVFGKEKSLNIYGNQHRFKGRKCEDAELQNLSEELWNEMIKRNYASEVKSGTVHLLRDQIDSKPDYCLYIYIKAENGEWKKS